MRKWSAVCLLAIMLSSCGEKQKQEEEDVLLRYGDNILTLREVVEHIPTGISSEDSTALFQSIVEDWVKDVVLSDFAEQRLYDTEAIDRKVKAYRNNLIVSEYLGRMQEANTPQIDESKVKDYYELHKNEIKLEVPLLKGIFLKFNNSIEDKETLRKLITSDKPESIDILEQEWIDKAVEYTYFRDKWIDWETLSGMIPYRFGNPDNFIKDHKYFETEYGDCIYLLQISDYIPSGEPQPYEFAQSWITNVLTRGALADYERALVNSLTEKAVKDNKLEIVGYDIQAHKMKDKTN